MQSMRKIYYITLSDDNKIYKMRTNGTKKTKLSEDQSYTINIAGDWIYYQNMSDDGKPYKMRPHGSERQIVD